MYSYGLQLLRQALDQDDAEFRDGQWAAITALVERQARVLVVQRTGWGKSLVYFLSTRLLRDRGAGCTILISPLLSLMRNQVAAAGRIGIRAATINSSNRDEWPEVEAGLHGNDIDLLLVSPERLANDEFVDRCLLPIAARVGLFVVDEAHCISDWGHDFRPNYRRIVRVLRALPSTIPVLATTATANDRVVGDITEQLGPNLEVQRGPLTRTSLSLQNLCLDSQAERLAWIADRLPQLPGSGIIYTLTVRDAEQVAEWLRMQGTQAEAYHADLDTEARELLEIRLQGNDLKVLVATVALGMGFDKPDLGFVIHYQRPASIVHYYQQVGRAGRAVSRAYGVLLHGEEDDEIANFFARTAFPTPAEVDQLLNAMATVDESQTLSMLQQRVNLPQGKIAKIMDFLLLESPAPVQKAGGRYVLNPVKWQMPVNRIERIMGLRRQELQRMQAYVSSRKCLMKFLVEELNDSHAEPCGQCVNCAGPLLPTDVSEKTVLRAQEFVDQQAYRIEPRRRWLSGLSSEGMKGRILPEDGANEGRALCRWGAPGLGHLIRRGKQHDGHFDDCLVEASVQLVLHRWRPDPAPTWITCIPSSRHATLVPNFAARLSGRLGIPFIESIRKVAETVPQKTRANSLQQAQNIQGAFVVDVASVQRGPVLLVDDIVDSGWTFTVAAALLRRAGSGPVHPFALADSSSENRD